MIAVEYFGTKKVYIDHDSGAVFDGCGSVVEFQNEQHARNLLRVKEIFRVAGTGPAPEPAAPEVEIKTLTVEVDDETDSSEPEVETAPQVDTVETMSDEEVMKLAKIHNLHSGKGRVNYDKLRAELAEALSAQARG